jgi:hypothetical protein
MESNGQNGYTNPRMDRIEKALELFIADHEAFRDEHKKLLTAQILLAESQQKTDEHMRALQADLKATDDRIGILVRMMDDFIRHSNRPSQ